jgi:uncharacterized damage-inducible protein DinB
MDLLKHAFEYDAWANDLTLSSVRDQGDAGDYARRLFSHVLAAQRIWLARLRREPPSVDVWPTLTIEQIVRLVRELPTAWSDFLSEAAENMDATCSYTNTAGKEYTTPIENILMHVIAHSAYHRGQIALELRKVGLQPAVTDLIAYTRR